MKFVIIICFLLIHCSKDFEKKLFKDPGFTPFSGALFKVIWSEPGISKETAVDKGIDKEWVNFIDSAENSIDIAVYNLGRQVIIDALLNARKRGITVRMVGDVDESMTKGYQSILRTDIPFALGNPTGIQHNKFAVRDNKFVMMGTGNLTDTDLMMNNNNFMVIESESISKAYKKEFEQMFYGRFAAKKEPKTDNRNHLVNGIPIELYFSPYDGVDAMNRLIELVDNAKTEIQFMIFAFTHSELTSALIRASNRGVLVRGIHDYTFIRGTSMVAGRLYNAGRFVGPNGPFVKEDGNENTKIPGLRTSGGKLHCKTMIFDQSIVATGSFNWSNNAINNNDENMLVIQSPFVAKELVQQWESVWSKGRPITNQINFDSGSVANKGDVVFSEILWAGSYESGATSGNPSRDDVWFELKNTTNRTIDLSNWVVTWDPKELTHYAIPDAFTWYEPGVHKLHSRGRIQIEPNGYILVKNANESLPVLNPNSFDNDSADVKISGTKKFSLRNSYLDLKLYDTKMNLIDRAGDGQPATSGILNPDTYRTHSMERFFYSDGRAYPGESASSWYSSNGNNKTNSLNGTGRLADTHSVCISSGSKINQGCTIGTPNSGVSNSYSASPSNPRGGILNQTNIPIDAYSINSDTIAIRMRWPLLSAPSITEARSVAIDPNDPGLLIVSLPQVPNQVQTLTVGNNAFDVTNQLAEGGNISFTGFSTDKAKLKIIEVWPGETGSRDKITLEVTQSGSAKGIGVYYFDNTSLGIANLVYRIGDIYVTKGEKIIIQSNTSNTLSDDKKIGQSVTISKGSNGIWDFYSSDPGFPSTDAVIYIGEDPKNPLDVMCFSNRDGDVAEEMMLFGYRYLFNNPKIYDFNNIFPVKGYNDYNVQAQCSNYSGGGSGKFLTRISDGRAASSFECPGCTQ